MKFDTGLKIALLACLAGIIARLFGFFVLPESAYADSLFHLKIISDALQTGIVQTPDLLTTPLYYYVGLAFYKISGFTVEMPFIRVIPFLVMIAQLVLSYVLLSRLFKSKTTVFAGLAFIIAFPWLVRYSPVNYIDQFASVFLLLFFVLLYNARETPSLKNLALLAVCIPLVVLSKITVAILLPVLLVSAWFLLSKSTSKIRLSAFLLAALILSTAWFAGSMLSDPSNSNPAVESASKPLPFNALLPQNLFKSFVSFFDFPSESAFSKFSLNQGIPWLFAAFAFAILVLFLAFPIIKGTWDSLREKNHFLISMLACIAVLLALSFYSSTDNNGIFYFRYFIPAIPLTGVFFAKGIDWLSSGNFKIAFLNSKELKIIVFLAFLLFSVYSLMLSAFSAMQYSKIAGQEMPLYAAIKELPEGSKIASLNKSRQVWFYTRMNASQPSGFVVEENSPETIYSVLKKEGFSHIAVSCNNDFWDRNALDSLKSDERISEVFSKDCLAIYKVN